MALILAIEPDKKQASAVRALARGSLKAQMLVADSTAHGLHQLDGRVPDLILTSLLLSPKDESALDTHLRALDAEGHRVPTLVIPVLGPIGRRSKGGLLNRLKKPKKTTGTEGCDPETFAEQITEYLDRAAAERALEEDEADEDDDELPIAASARPAAIRPEKRAAPPEPDDSPVEAVAGSVFGRISTFEPATARRQPAPGIVESASAEVESAFAGVESVFAKVEPAFAQAEPAVAQAQSVLAEPTPDPLPQERLLKDPFSIEGLTVPGGSRTKTAPEPIFEAAEPRFQFAAPPPNGLSPVAEAPVEIPAAGNDAWDEITIETSDSLEITAEPIDLNAFVQELERVVPTFAKPAAVPAIAAEIKPIAEAVPREQGAKADQPISLAIRYAWPKLEGLPAGVDWEITKPGDPDYELLADFMAAFEPSAVPSRKRSESAVTPAPPAVPAPPALPAGREDWASLTMRLRYSWPPLEGIECVDLLAEIEPDETGLYTITDPEPPRPQPRPSLLRPATPAPPVAKPTPPVEPAVKATARMEPAAKPAARIQSAVKAATPIVPAPRTDTKTTLPPSTVKAVAPAAPAPRTAAPVVAPPRTGARIESAVKPTAASRPSTAAVPPGPAPEIRAVAPLSPAAAAPGGAPPAAQWLEILSAIRRDIQELRAEQRADPPAGAAPESNATATPPSARSKAVPSATADDAVRVARTRKPQPPAPAPSARPVRKRKRPLPPKQDEWGFFDPDQCGFAALLAKLEEIEGDEPIKP